MTTPPPPTGAGPDVRAVVRVAEALTMQVRRIADALTTPVDDALQAAIAAALTAEHYRRAEARIVASPEKHCAAMADAVMRVLKGDDAPTTGNDDRTRCVCGDPIELAGDPAVWRHSIGGTFGLDAHTPRPPDWLSADAPTTLATTGTPGPAEAAEWTRQAGKASATIEALTANAGCSEHPNAGSVGPYCLACTIVPPPSGPCEHRGPHPGFTCAEVDATQPYFRVRWDQEQPAAAAEDAVCRRMETRTCPPSYNGPCGDRPCARFESDDPAPWTNTAEAPAAEGTHPLTSPAWRPGEGYDRCPRRVTGLQCVFRAGHPPHGCAGATSNPGTPTDEDAQRTDRRNSLLNLLARLDRDGVLVIGERMRMRLHVEAEIRESDTARAVAAGNKRHVQELYADLEKANQAARRALEQRQEMAEERYVIQKQRDTADRLRDRHAAVLAEVLAEFQPLEEGSTVYMAGPLDATKVEQWRSATPPTVTGMRAELEQAQAAIERARVLLVAVAQATATGASDYDIGRHELAVEAYTALEGPTETKG